MNQTVDTLCRARELYASAPSHLPLGQFPSRGTYCAVYAIGESNDWTLGAAYTALCDAMGVAHLDAEPTAVAKWNAKHSTEEVLAAFDRAITAEGLRVPPLQRTERTVPVHAGQES